MFENENNPTLTIFTPSYNRAHTLGRTYESLKNQKCKDFIWLIIDDGSTDETAKLVESWIRQNNEFEIQYIYKKNGGMHTAHNSAYENIHTEINTCIDSDDALASDAVELIIKKWNQIREKGYAGIIALDADMKTGKIIGRGFPPGLTETTVSGYYEAGGSGDKKLIYRTDIINSYPPYPVFEGEKYVSLAYKYRLIDQAYKMAVLDEVVCNVEYQQDGSSNTMFSQYLNNPKGFAFWRKVRMQTSISNKRLFIDCVHYISSCVLSHDKNFLKDSPRKLMTILAIPFGFMLSVYIKWKAK